MKRYLVRYKLSENAPEKTLKIYANSPDEAESISFDLLKTNELYYTDAVLINSYSKTHG